jgi:hypothetical protein
MHLATLETDMCCTRRVAADAENMQPDKTMRMYDTSMQHPAHAEPKQCSILPHAFQMRYSKTSFYRHLR